MADKIYIGDVGTKFIIATGVDLANANSLKVNIKRPDGSITTWTCEKEGQPADGNMSYISKAGDISCGGVYQGNAKVKFSTGEEFTGETFQFTVYGDFDELPL